MSKTQEERLERMSKTQEERLGRRNATMENFTHLKICPWASPEIKCDLIKALPPWSQLYILVCACVCARMPVCVCFSYYKCCHTVFPQPRVLSTTDFLSFINAESGFEEQPALVLQWGRMSQASDSMAPSLYPFHSSNLKGLQTSRDRYLSPPLSWENSTCLTVLNSTMKVCSGIPE